MRSERETLDKGGGGGGGERRWLSEQLRVGQEMKRLLRWLDQLYVTLTYSHCRYYDDGTRCKGNFGAPKYHQRLQRSVYIYIPGPLLAPAKLFHFAENNNNRLQEQHFAGPQWPLYAEPLSLGNDDVRPETENFVSKFAIEADAPAT